MRSNNRQRKTPSASVDEAKKRFKQLNYHPVTEEPREASLSAYQDQPLGVCLLLTIADLRALDITIEDTHAVEYWVDSENNQLKISTQED